MAEKEYIEREAAFRAILGQPPEPHYPEWYYRNIEELPAADVVEVVHAHWIDRDEKTWCSNCDASNKQYKPPYCPHCGAKMYGGKHETD